MSLAKHGRTRVWFNQNFSSVRTAMTLIRQADTEGRYTLLASASSAHAGAALEADAFFIEPETSDREAYLEWCLSFVQSAQVDIFVPGKEARFLGVHRERFAELDVRLLCAAAPADLKVMNDKDTFYHQVACPEAPPGRWRDFNSLAGFDKAWDELVADATDGLCMKPSQSVYGIGFARIREDRTTYQLFASGQTHAMTLADVRRMLSEQTTVAPLLLMDYLGGDEYSVDCAADHGRLGWAVARRKSHGRSQVIDESPVVQRACARITAQFGLNGVVNIQFRSDSQGQLHVLEVNPRMSGGMGMACLAGPNLPYLALRGFDLGYDSLPECPIEAPLTVALVSGPVILARAEA